MKMFSVLLAVIGLGLCSCERHKWESETPKSSDTINLFKHEDHSKEGHSEDGGHKTAGEHGHKEGEGDEEKKAAE